MSEDNMSTHSMPLMTFHGINALLEINDNQNRNMNNQNDPFVSFKKRLEKASKRIIYENNELNKKYNVYIQSQIDSYQNIYKSCNCCKNVIGANVVYVVASAFVDVVRKIPLHKGITKGLKII